MKSVILTLAVLAVAAALPAETTRPVRITTYNIHSAIPDGYNNSNYTPGLSDLRNIADVMTTAGADIIGLQEVRNQWPNPEGTPGTPPDMPRELGRLLNMNYAYASNMIMPSYEENREYHSWGTPGSYSHNGKAPGHYGNAVLSRFPMSEPKTIKLPMDAKNPGADKDEPRNAIRVEIKDVPGLSSVVVYNTHFQHTSGQTRQRQMAMFLKEAAKESSGTTVFLLGDFNHFPHAGEPDLLGMAKQGGFHDLAAVYAKSRNEQPEASLESGRRIDYIFCNKLLTITDVSVLKTKVSDHYPVTVTIQP